jgi:hypothetical protein
MTQKETIEQWTANKAMDLIKNYDSLGLRASGKWAKDIETKIEEKGLNYRVTFLGSAYTQQLVSGRRPNSNQDKDSIKGWVGWAGSTFLRDWVKNKGLSISPFAVAYKIAREGIKVPNQHNPGTILSNVFTNECIDLLLKDLKTIIVGELITDIKTIFA